jgi:hypothetical protein
MGLCRTLSDLLDHDQVHDGCATMETASFAFAEREFQNTGGLNQGGKHAYDYVVGSLA